MTNNNQQFSQPINIFYALSKLFWWHSLHHFSNLRRLEEHLIVLYVNIFCLWECLGFPSIFFLLIFQPIRVFIGLGSKKKERRKKTRGIRFFIWQILNLLLILIEIHKWRNSTILLNRGHMKEKLILLVLFQSLYIMQNSHRNYY